jgi:hypothetical protein
MLLCAFVAGTLIPAHLRAAEGAAVEAPVKPRPRIGLVLGGGGAPGDPTALQFFDAFAERRFRLVDAVLADFHCHLILAACARFPCVGLVAETRAAGSTKHFKFNVKRGHNKSVLATAGSCLFGLFKA